VAESVRPDPQTRFSTLGFAILGFTGLDSRNAPGGSSNPGGIHSDNPGCQQPPSCDQRGRSRQNQTRKPKVRPQLLRIWLLVPVLASGIRQGQKSGRAIVAESAGPAPRTRFSTLERLRFTGLESENAPRGNSNPCCIQLDIPIDSNRQAVTNEEGRGKTKREYPK